MTKREAFGACIPPWEPAGLAMGSAVLLAFSGGADSMALLDMLAKLRSRIPFSLTLAHVDHGIRGEEAARDRRFCMDTAAAYGLEICVLETDVPRISRESGEGLEEAARRIRYDYFAKLMQEREIPILCTAHHADDHFETLLFRLSRGTGSAGMRGILPARPFGGGMLVRPILSLTRADILDYCRENNLQYVTDSTNADTAYARNRIRAEVTPILEEMFPGASRRALRLSEDIAEDEAYFEELADAFLASYTPQSPIPVEELRKLPSPVLRRVLTSYAASDAATPEREHVEAMQRLISAPTMGMRIALPKGLYAAVCDGNLILTTERTAPSPTDFCIPFEEGTYDLPHGLRLSVASCQKTIKVHNLSTPPYINLIPMSDIISKDLVWRPMRPGDRICIRGMHRRVRRLYAEVGVCPLTRKALPLLSCGDEILYAPGIGLCDALRNALQELSADALCYLIRVSTSLEPNGAVAFDAEQQQSHQNTANADNGGKKI